MRRALRRWQRWLVAAALVSAACAGVATAPQPLPQDFFEEGRGTYSGSSYSTTPMGRGNTGEWDPGMTTAAHRSLPLGTCVLVTNLENGMEARVYITDHGAYSPGVIIDLSRVAARKLGMLDARNGLARVRLTPCH